VKQISHYTFIQKFCIGEGNYGKVFAGFDSNDNSSVAIKQIDLKFINHDAYIKN
jgi:serine/threonine protein kinase